MIELDLMTLTILTIICLGVYAYCIHYKPYLLKYAGIGYILLLVFIGL